MSSVEKLNVKISSGSKQLLAFEDLKTYGSDQGKELRVLLPARAFPKGPYKIEAFASARPDAPLTYSFTVE